MTLKGMDFSRKLEEGHQVRVVLPLSRYRKGEVGYHPGHPIFRPEQLRRCAEYTGEGLGEDDKFSFPGITHACISFKR